MVPGARKRPAAAEKEAKKAKKPKKPKKAAKAEPPEVSEEEVGEEEAGEEEAGEEEAGEEAGEETGEVPPKKVKAVKRPAAKTKLACSGKTHLSPDIIIDKATVCLKGPFTSKSYIVHKIDGKDRLVCGVDKSRSERYHEILQTVMKKIKEHKGDVTKKMATDWRDSAF